MIEVLRQWCKDKGFPEPVPEFRFHKTRKWRFDVAFPTEKLAVEVDGGLYVRGRHSRGAGRERDMEKLNEAICLGWRVLVVSPKMVKNGRLLNWLSILLPGKITLAWELVSHKDIEPGEHQCSPKK